MLALTCERAQIEDGMELLDLGCGWGSLTFWLAERYPACRILAVSNSRTQRAFIESQARERDLRTIEVVTADANVFDVERRFDRVVSVEMLEHARNYEALLGRIAGWLEPGGKLFVHVFSHRELAYAYESGWMARHFFTAGTMPSHDLIPHFAEELALEQEWAVSGLHYARTAEAWLARMDDARGEVLRRLVEDLRSGRRASPAHVAHLLHGLRRALGLPLRVGVGRLPLPVLQAVTSALRDPSSFSRAGIPRARPRPRARRRKRARAPRPAHPPARRVSKVVRSRHPARSRSTLPTRQDHVGTGERRAARPPSPSPGLRGPRPPERTRASSRRRPSLRSS